MKPQSVATFDPPSSAQASSSRSFKIYWDKGYAYHTDFFIEWCNNNPTQCFKLFSDSTQDVCEEGWTKSQLTSVKKSIYYELAQYIFENEVELTNEPLFPLLNAAFQAKYNEQVKWLGQTGAELSIEDLWSGEKMKGLIETKGLIGSILKDFPWFPSLHSWWRTKPTYNMAFNSSDPGQNFAVQAASLFNIHPTMPMSEDRMPPLPPEPLPSATVTTTTNILILPTPTTHTLANPAIPPVHNPFQIEDGEELGQHDCIDADFARQNLAGILKMT
ncbi:hypothetical protein J3R83DRAFT_9904 [Lanmaoa asiatica]|nr:hypothetical protein J3R83DRAFT_9904 [Lanmaoa asiatica]